MTDKFATLNFEEALIGLIAARHKVSVGASFFLHVSSSNQYLSIVAQPVRSTVHVPAFFPPPPLPCAVTPVTGGIGSGKSTIASLFVEQGAFLVDADAISRSLMEPGEAVLARTVAEFGEHLLDEDGRLNRPALARIVFNDERRACV